MRKCNPKNERIKHRYLAYLEEAKRFSSKSADQAAAAINQFEQSAGYKDFSRFHIEQARRFKRLLSEQVNTATGRPLAKATTHSRLMALKAFFHWLAGQPGFKSRITYSDAEYFNPSANDSRIATAKRESPVPGLEQIRHAISSAPTQTVISKRDQALMAFIILTGARDDATASFLIRHMDFAKRTVFQDARQVRTKNRKTFTSRFFPVGNDIKVIVRDWVHFLETELHFGPDDPLFPATRLGHDANHQFVPVGFSRRCWSNADSIRRIFRQLFEAAGLPYFNPHSFRKTLVRLGERICRTPEEFKTWSENLGHEHVLTTFTSYGAVPSSRQAAIFDELWLRTRDAPSDGEPDAETVAAVLAYLQRRGS